MTKSMKPLATRAPDAIQLRLPPGKSEQQARADLAVDGTLGNAALAMFYGAGTHGQLGITESMAALSETVSGVKAGDLGAAESMLTTQAVALNAIFGELARRASMNMGSHMEAFERYMRLALKAQGQARATLETLAAIKNPPVVFARQANINNGGQQQVNNGAAPATHDAKSQTPETPKPQELGVVFRADAGIQSSGAKR